MARYLWLNLVFFALFATVGCVAADDPQGAVVVSTVAQSTATPITTPAPSPTKAALQSPSTPVAQADACSSTPAGPTPVSTRLLPPQSVVEPRSFKSLPLIEQPALQQRLKVILGSEAKSTAFAVKDLQTGRGASMNGDQSFNTASLFKLFVMFEVLHQESIGVLRDSQTIKMTPYYEEFGLGPRATRLCQELTVRQALQAMMSVSDNAAAVLLQDLVGSSNINQAMSSIGLTATSLLPEGTTTSASDTARLLEGIGRRELIDAAASERMMLLMAQEQFDNGLRAGLPKDAVLVHKTGNWGDATNDAGIVFTPKGTYVIVVLSTSPNATSIIKDIASATLAYFD